MSREFYEENAKKSSQWNIYYSRSVLTRWFLSQRKLKTILNMTESEWRHGLDIGCGDGGIAFKLMERGFKVTGIDISATRLHRAHKLNCEPVLGDAMKLPFKDQSFDFSIISELLEHLQNPEDAIKESIRVTKDCGGIIIILPNDRNFLLARLLAFRLKEVFKNRGHLHSLDVDSLFSSYKILEKCGIPISCLPFSLSLLYAIKIRK